MTFAGMNYLAVLAAAVAAWIIGAAWYMALAKPWLAAQGRTMEEVRRQQQEAGAAAAIPYGISFVSELLMAWVLAGVIGHLGPGQVTVRNGIVSALFLWLGFVATTTAVNYTFGNRSLKLYAIDVGHWLVALLAMGAIIGAFGV